MVAVITAGGCVRNPYRLQVDAAPWIRSVGSDDLFESDPAQDRLVSLGPAVVPLLETALGREPPAVRLGIVEVLWRLDSPESDRLLLQVARADPDDEVRSEAVRVLDDVRDPGRTVAVEAALADRSARVRMAAAQLCARLCASNAAIDRLVDLALNEPGPGAGWARASVAQMLAEGEGTRGAAARRAIDREAGPVLRSDAGLETRLRAALLLADAGDTQAVPTLIEGATSSSDVRLRQHALHAIGTIGGATAVPAVAALAGDANPSIAAYAGDALRRMATREVPEAKAVLRRTPALASGPPLPRPVP